MSGQIPRKYPRVLSRIVDYSAVYDRKTLKLRDFRFGTFLALPGIDGSGEDPIHKKEGELMLIRIYEALWGLVALAALVIYLTSGFDAATAVVFGFICFGLIYMGMMGVLPVTANRHVH